MKLSNVHAGVVPNQGSVVSPERQFPPFPNQFESEPIHRQRVKLPEISIPPFTGEISQWTSFMELFSALILNDSSLTSIQKFIYLKSYLRGEPVKLIDTLELTNDNFKIALEILKDRYENKLVILNTYINALLDYPVLLKCTSQSLRDLLQIVKETSNL